jgi:hypothetical protein
MFAFLVNVKESDKLLKLYLLIINYKLIVSGFESGK